MSAICEVFNMRYNFTQLPAKLPYPPYIKGKLSTIHSKAISEVIGEYSGSFRQRCRIVDALNTISYNVIENNSADYYMSLNRIDVLDLSTVDNDICKSRLGSLYILERDINWDIQPVDVDVKSDQVLEYSTKAADEAFAVSKVVESSNKVIDRSDYTPKSDLYIQPPVIPRFNIKNVFAAGKLDGTVYTVYASEPKIPTKQNEISITTDISLMTDEDFLRLYPNQMIRTRSEILYDKYPGIKYNDIVGSIIPVAGFTDEELLDNVVKYPHIFKLYKKVNSTIVSFYTTIEIDGELHKVSDVWSSLPESDVIPYNVDFIKEYVVRRYLLERDIKKVDHKYPMYGTLLPYLTLFTSQEDYRRLGYNDTLGIAKQCVMSRISYKTSRNPVLRRLNDA